MPSIDVPGSGNVSLANGQSLTINFKQHCKFCVTAENGATFNPALPSGQVFTNGNVWTGTATATGSVQFDHVDKDANCGAGKRVETGGRTITVTGTAGKAGK